MTLLGTFLISRGVVTATEVVHALDVQRAQRLPLASVAMKLGVLDAHQALRTMDEEKRTKREFADCAVDLGFATRDQLKRVVDASAESGPRLGELLVSLGYLTVPELEREVAALRRFEMATPRFGVPRPSTASGTRRRDERGGGIIELARRDAGGSR